MEVTLVVDSLSSRLSGIGRYTWELCKRLPDQPCIESVNYFVNGRFVRDPRRLLLGEKVRSRSRYTKWVAQGLARRRLAPTLVHSPNYFLPREATTGIITVHDLSVFRYPETHPVERRAAFARHFEDSVDRAIHIITDTETVRQELVADFSVPEEKVTAIPLGVDARYRPRPNNILRPQLAPLGLRPGGYGLCVSTLEPRKKISELLSAWRVLPRALRQSTPLVLAGGEGWLNDNLHEQIGDAAAAGWLKHVEFVPESLLQTLYAGALLFLYPSVYEGFGLPPVEAMASGVPVLVAKRSCLPEVCGAAAGYVDPDDPQEFSNIIAEALTDADWRKQMSVRGLDRAARFTWEKCTTATVDVYRAVCR